MMKAQIEPIIQRQSPRRSIESAKPNHRRTIALISHNHPIAARIA
jgi:hypothetical protein